MNDRSVNPPAANRLVDEAALIEGLKSGDDAAAETFVREHAARMHAVARRLLGNDDDAADAVQDAFISAFRAIGDFEGGSKLSTWLHRITVNAALMKLRKSQRRGEVSIESLLPAYHDDGHRASNEGGWNTPPEQALEQSELQQVVRRQIHQLPEDYRNVILLRDIEQLDTNATAEILQIKPGLVKVRLHRARQALRTLLERELT